jgi:hypothetical protein
MQIGGGGEVRGERREVKKVGKIVYVKKKPYLCSV